MIKRLDYFGSIILIIMGAAHTALTPVLAKEFNSDALDFVAIGMVFIFLGFINIALIRTFDNIITLFCLIANLLVLIWLCLSFIKSNSFEIQGIIPLIITSYLTIRAFVKMKNNRSKGFLNINLKS